ncbi:MAG: SDR family oxidoreductase [Deltaproteobacteria bacterium]|nr:SDR family oxidoreductase [Deltaproteobacteria bacterium]
MTMRFKDRVVYVTGAASGIGRATAELFAAEGAKVFAVDVNQEGVRETLAAIRAAGGRAEGGLCNVADLNSVKASIADALKAFGALNVLVNAAGVGRSLRFEELDETEWQRVIGVNLNGPFYTMRVAIEHLLKQPGGSIVNVASIAGLRGQAYNSHYCASKAGVLNLTRAVAVEFATRGLRANCVCPGGVNTPIVHNFVPRPDFETQLILYYCPPSPTQMGEPIDIARTIAFLASDEARMVNGAALVADFGTVA